MADEFLESLVCAVGEFIGDVALYGLAGALADSAVDSLFGTGTVPAQRQTYSPWADTLGRLGEKPATLGVPEQRGIQGIRAADPSFDLAAFLVRVGQMFASFHDAVDRGDLAPTRRFVDETYFAQIAPAAERIGRRVDGPRVLTIKAIRPITALHENGFDLVRIFITAAVAGEADLICEYWEVYRKRGTLTKAGLDITHCPNCGGPVDGLDPTRCAYCGTRLADPALDWVVRKITPQ